MFADNTVFIVGAGASAEFNLPVGWQLMNRIKKNSRFHFDEYGDLRGGVPLIVEVLRQSDRSADEIKELFKAMGEIHRSIDLAGSIDEFINRHYNDMRIAECGKLQIAYAIAQAERGSFLAAPKPSGVGTPQISSEPLSWDNVSGTWIKTFAQLLFEGVRNDDVEQVGNNITIICFNYDRCIEHYLTEAIVKTFRGVDRETALRIVGRIKIIHPYGSLGKLGQHPFGGEISTQKLRAMSENIVTWSESVESTRKEAIDEALLSASTLVFLGFAFAPQNMKLLSSQHFRDHSLPFVEVYATGYGYDDVIDARLRNKIVNLYVDGSAVTGGDFIHIQYNMKCAKLLQAHSMALVA